MALRTRFVQAGGWRTLESFWNARGTAFFRQPAGAKVRVRYSGNSWWNGYTAQERTLDGSSFVKLTVGIGSIAYARIQMRTDRSGEVTYDVYPGGVAVTSPEIPF